MPDQVDALFHDRADAHIELANAQLEDTSRAKVSGSMLYATARFQVWLNACAFARGDELRAKRRRVLEQCLRDYRALLEENLDDYIAHFDEYMTTD